MSETVRYEFREPPADPKLRQAAKEKPGSYVYDIDWPYPDNQPTPPEAIRGSWEIDSDGNITTRYAVNAKYRAIVHCSRLLKPYMHAGAKHTRDQWIVEIDPRGEPLFPAIPNDLVRGWWYVNKEGIITDQFRPNAGWTEDRQEGRSSQ